MSKLSGFFTFRQATVSLPLMLLTAFMVIGFIRLSAHILPSAFYFSVSSVFKSDNSLMLVEHPGISAERMCVLAEKLQLAPSDLGLNDLYCDEESYAFSSWGQKLSQDDRDRIVDHWIDNRDRIMTGIDAALSQRDLYNVDTLPRVYFQPGMSANRLMSDYLDAHGRAVTALVSEEITAALEKPLRGLVDDLAARTDSGDGAPASANAQGRPTTFVEEEWEFLSQATARQTWAVLDQQDVAATIKHPGVREMLAAIDDTWQPGSLAGSIASKYAEQIIAPANEIAARFLDQGGLQVSRIEDSKMELQKAIVFENLPTYVMAASIRAFIVFLAVFVAALALTRNIADEPSFSFGAAFAGLLLVWPVVALWDNVVQLEWQDMRFRFLIIYAIYVAAFYFTGKFAFSVARLVAARTGLQRHAFAIVHGGGTAGREGAVQVSVRKVITEMGVALSLNAAAYSLNLVVPISGS